VCRRYADVQTYSVHWDRFLPFIRFGSPAIHRTRTHTTAHAPPPHTRTQTHPKIGADRRDKLWSPEFLPFLRGITVRRRFRKKRPTARFYYNPAFFDDDGGAAAADDDFGGDEEEDDVEGFDEEELDGGGGGDSQQLRAGDRSAEFRDVVVEEDGLKYHVDLRTSALSSGLFLDQRYHHHGRHGRHVR
jgi:hypothetical protein